MQAIKDIKAGLGRVLCKTGEQIEVVCCVEASAQVTRAPVTLAPVLDVSNLRVADRSEADENLITKAPPLWPTDPFSLQNVTNIRNTCSRMSLFRCSFPVRMCRSLCRLDQFEQCERYEQYKGDSINRWATRNCARGQMRTQGGSIDRGRHGSRAEGIPSHGPVGLRKFEQHSMGLRRKHYK